MRKARKIEREGIKGCEKRRARFSRLVRILILSSNAIKAGPHRPKCHLNKFQRVHAMANVDSSY